MDEFRIGTRKSALAMIQTRMVAERIFMAYPGMPVTVIPCITRGDVNLKSPIADFGGKGAFVAEIEQLLVIALIAFVILLFTVPRICRRKSILALKSSPYFLGRIRRRFCLPSEIPAGKFLISVPPVPEDRCW